MGKKIPGKKHRGVKDPYEIQARKFEKIKHKVNRKPSDVSEQELTRGLQDIIKFRTTGSLVTKKIKKKLSSDLIDGSKFINREQDQPGMTRPLKLLPLLQQKKKESVNKFLKRVNIATQAMIREAEFENKFQVDVERDECGKVINMNKREIDPLLNMESKKPNIRKMQEKQIRLEEKKRILKECRLKKKYLQSKIDIDEFAYLKDEVEFGEFAYEPPKLETHKILKKAKLTEGQSTTKDFLFMKKLRGEDITKKCRLKPNVGQHRIMEDERLRAVAAYRAMKSMKRHTVMM